MALGQPLRGGPSLSMIAARRAPGCAAIFAEWIAPMRPAPNWQNVIIGRSFGYGRQRKQK